PDAFDVALQDATDAVTIGTSTVAGLVAGASTTLTYSWSTGASSLGTHTLTASHTRADDNAANDQASTTVAVNSPSIIIHIGDLDGSASQIGRASCRVSVL